MTMTTTKKKAYFITMIAILYKFQGWGYDNDHDDNVEYWLQIWYPFLVAFIVI